MNWGNWSSPKVIPPFGAAGSSIISASLGLQTNLSAFWEFETTAWLDSVGSNNLTGVGTPLPSTVAGKVGNAVAFLANDNQYLTHADNASLEVGGVDFSLAAWIYTANSGVSAPPALVAKFTSGFPSQGYALAIIFSSGFQFQFIVYANGQTGAATANNFGFIPAGTGWYYVVGTFSNSTKVASISVNAGTPDTFTLSNVVSSDTAPFYLGTDNSLTGGASDYYLDQVGLWKNRILTSSDISALYNGGAGLSYAQMA